MKLLAGILFALAAFVNAPSPCAHAMGVERAGSDHQTDAMADHGAMDQASMSTGGAHAGHHEHMKTEPSDHEGSHEGCAGDCDGGFGCDGCAMGAAAVLAQDGETRCAAPAIAHLPVSDLHDGAPLATEPPPPRAA
ncbi:MAG: hypothetical protein AAFW81_00500 [Pseudomonadota bacterium]